MFLTPEELTELTGYKRQSSQRAWLAKNEIPYLIAGNEQIKVLRDTVILRLGGCKGTPIVKAEPQLRFDSIRRREPRKTKN